MRKKNKALALHRETVRHLTDLREIGGAAPDKTSLQYSRCPSCGIVPCTYTSCQQESVCVCEA